MKEASQTSMNAKDDSDISSDDDMEQHSANENEEVEDMVDESLEE